MLGNLFARLWIAVSVATVVGCILVGQALATANNSPADLQLANGAPEVEWALAAVVVLGGLPVLLRAFHRRKIARRGASDEDRSQ